jgi:1-acyl-sn-glycerol-3-phosphate acyltransferase
MFLSVPIWTIITLPLILFSTQFAVYSGGAWCKMILYVLEKICDVKYKIEGKENLPKHACLIASKHQSAWDTIAFLALVSPPPAYVLKRELIYLPAFGFYLRQMKMVFIDRKKGVASLKKMNDSANKILASGRNIVIFPEGTRTKIGQNVKYHRGIYSLYVATGKEVVPVALNSALCWGKNSFIKKPGTITLKFLPSLKTGLEKNVFMQKLEKIIQREANKLIV